MELFSTSQEVGRSLRGCVLTVGNFDGLHLGHQALLSAVVERGRHLSQLAALYTFEPHPRRVLHPEEAQPRLMSWPQLEQGLEAAGIDFVIREPFTLEFSALSAEAFLREVIADRIAPQEIFVGRNFHFGKGRSGSCETLRQLGPELGVGVEIIPQVRLGDVDVSSSHVRSLLGGGDVAAAAACLGRPYTIWAEVVHGEHRGRMLGFPTANLAPENDLIPKRGVYATFLQFFEGDRPAGTAHPSVANVGSRPTFEPGQILSEAHLIDFDGDLYGRRISLSFIARLRDEQRFPSPDALSRQIAADVEKARKILASARLPS